MKKYLLLYTALTVASSAYALDCATPPTCAEWGFTMSTDDCAGKFVLRCPREPNNDNAVFCGGEATNSCVTQGYTLNDGGSCGTYQNKETCSSDSSYYKCSEKTAAEKCKIDGYTLRSCETGCGELCPYDSSYMTCEVCVCNTGSVLYDDMQCYNTAPDGLTPIAIVVDPGYGIAIDIYERDNWVWSEYPGDVSKLNNYTSASDAKSASEDGYTNTQAIIAEGYEAAASYCSSLTDGKTRWFLPSAIELYWVYEYQDAINEGFSKVGDAFSGPYWASTEYDTYNAWTVDVHDGTLEKVEKTEQRPVRCMIAY